MKPERGPPMVLCTVEDTTSRVRHGGRVQPGGDEAGEVRHVDPELGAHLVGDRAERREVELARVGRPAGDDDLRLVLERLVAHDVHVDAEGLGVDAVGVGLVELAGEVELHAVGEVAAVGELEAEDACRRAWRCADSTAALAEAPECGCTLAYSAPNSDLARSMARSRRRRRTRSRRSSGGRGSPRRTCW